MRAKLNAIELEKNVFGVYKPAGATPLQTLQELKKLRPDLQDAPLTYAGRLDPMAEGLLLVLAGEKVYEKETYLGLDKTYAVTALLGVETDSWDLLGIPRLCKTSGPSQTESGLKSRINSLLQQYVGTMPLPLPPFSSPPHQGKPLFWWAQQGVRVEKERVSTIYEISNCTVGEVSASKLMQYTTETIPKVVGEFRQANILSMWNKICKANTPARYTLASFIVQCGSGTYIRGLVHDLGTKLNTAACVYRLVRTQVGQYHLS